MPLDLHLVHEMKANSKSVLKEKLRWLLALVILSLFILSKNSVNIRELESFDLSKILENTCGEFLQEV